MEATGAEVERRRRVESSAVGASIEVPKEPRGEVCGGGVRSPPWKGFKFFDF